MVGSLGYLGLKYHFPRLYTISDGKDKKITELDRWVDQTWEWNLEWRCRKFVWETQQEVYLMQILWGQNC